MYQEELYRLVIYLVIDYYKRKFKLIEQTKSKFTLTNKMSYKIKFAFYEYIYIKYYSIINKGNIGLNKDDCDYYIYVIPINDRAWYRHDFKFILISTDNIINLIIEKKYISDKKKFMNSKYKFRVQDIINNGARIF
jgi:hypothetical protein